MDGRQEPYSILKIEQPIIMKTAPMDAVVADVAVVAEV